MPYLPASPPGPPGQGRGAGEGAEPRRGKGASRQQLQGHPQQDQENTPTTALQGHPRQDGAPRIPTLHSQLSTLHSYLLSHIFYLISFISYLLSPIFSLHPRIQTDRSGKRLRRFPLLQSIYNPSRPVSRSAGRRWDSRPPPSWRAGSRRRCRCRRRRQRRSPPPPRWG